MQLLIQNKLKDIFDNEEFVIEYFRETIFDKSYLDFLEKQIELNVRGTEWSKVLENRLASFYQYCDCKHIDLHVNVSNKIYWIKMNAECTEIIYIENQN